MPKVFPELKSSPVIKRYEGRIRHGRVFGNGKC